MRVIISIFIISIITVGCVSQKKLALFQDVPLAKEVKATAEELEKQLVVHIKPYDLISVFVKSKDEETDAFINASIGGGNLSNLNNNSSQGGMFGYRVDAEGYINLPLIGKVKVLELKLDEAENLIKTKFKEFIKEPCYVKVVHLTFRVFVVNENGVAQIVQLQRESSTVLDALSSTGGFSDFGKRESVRVIRNYPKEPKLYILDFTKIECMESEGFYLQSNDIIMIDAFTRKNLIINVGTFNIFYSLLNTALIIVALITTLNTK